MRLALLTHEPFYPPSGGGSAAAVYMVREWVRRGHQVDVFGPLLPDGAAVEKEFGIRLRPFTQWRMGRTTPLRTAKYLAYPVALASLVRRTVASGHTYDALVAQHSISAVAAGMLRRWLGVPVVFNLLDCLTGFMETWPAYLMPRPVARALVRYELGLPGRYEADGVLTVSDALRERVVARGFPADRVLAAYYGFDAALFSRPEKTPPPSDPGRPPILVMHGSFDHHHLGPIARDAVIGVAKARPDARFRFVGPKTGALQAFAEGVRKRLPDVPLELTGFVPYREIPSRLIDATVGMTPYEPSTGTHCAFVAKTVEYLALGLPVVSTPLESAVRYYSGLQAVTFSAADGAGFDTEILRWLALTPDARANAVAPATAKVRSELDWSALCARATDFIEKTAAHPRPRRGL